MTWRAFIIGLLLAALLGWVEPLSSFIAPYGAWFSYSSFPSGPVFVLVVLTLGGNVLLKILPGLRAFRRAELLLIFSMMFVAAAVPCEGIGRYFGQMLAGPPYLARRTEIPWEQEGGALAVAPEGLVLSRDPLSTAAKQYFEGAGESGRIPWAYWAKPLAHWATFLIPMYFAVFFVCGMLRRQWVEVERLMFPLARVPLEFTRGAGEGWLPSIFHSKGFLLGLIFTTSWRLLLGLPKFWGGTAIPVTIPFADALQGTPLEGIGLVNLGLDLPAIGFAFLVPADVSLSVWLFFFFARVEVLMGRKFAIAELARPNGEFLRWQQFGAYAAFTVGMAVAARRHLWAVVTRAFGRGQADDSAEPIGYSTAFWGFWVCMALCMAWYIWHGMRPLTAVAMLALIFMAFLVYARIVAQGGLYVATKSWGLSRVIHSLSGGTAFSPAGAVIASMQGSIFLSIRTTMLAPQTMNVFRIASVFRRRRIRWLFPALAAAVLVALVAMTHQLLRQAYGMGAANFHDTLQTVIPAGSFWQAHNMIVQPRQSVSVVPSATVLGAVVMSVVMALRARFYWWPIHPIGFLACMGFHAQRLWLPFLIGWTCKVGVMKLAGGQVLRQARDFFIALILTHYTLSGFSGVLSLLTRGTVTGI